MTPIDFSDILTHAVAAATTAGRSVAAARRSRSIEVNYKGALDLVTSADLEADRLIGLHLKEHFPDHRILSEESSPNLAPAELSAGPIWIVDPIDGTTNFAHGLPHVGVSIAFALDGVVHVGVVHNPFMGETYHAVKGRGAFLNGEPIRCSATTELKAALVATGFPYKRNERRLLLACINRVLESCRDIRRLGACSLDLCYVASGVIQAYYETVEPWDMAAGALIAGEAGARRGSFSPTAADYKGPADLYSRDLLVAAPAIYDDLAALLALARDDVSHAA